jgi:hypothetical protein
MKKLLAIVDQLATHVPDAKLVDNAISEVNIAWHIEHACLVIIKITETIKQSNPQQYNSKFNFKKMLVFITGKFPRGRAKAPASVMPQAQFDQAVLIDSIGKAKLAITELNNCDRNQFFLHPIFGNLNKRSTLHFLGIHTKHHLRIIQDILK